MEIEGKNKNMEAGAIKKKQRKKGNKARVLKEGKENESERKKYREERKKG
jgi:hypothetical protein